MAPSAAKSTCGAPERKVRGQPRGCNLPRHLAKGHSVQCYLCVSWSHPASFVSLKYAVTCQQHVPRSPPACLPACLSIGHALQPRPAAVLAWPAAAAAAADRPRGLQHLPPNPSSHDLPALTKILRAAAAQHRQDGWALPRSAFVERGRGQRQGRAAGRAWPTRGRGRTVSQPDLLQGLVPITANQQ